MSETDWISIVVFIVVIIGLCAISSYVGGDVMFRKPAKKFRSKHRRGINKKK